MDNQRFAAQEAEHVQLDMIGREIVNKVEVCVCVCVWVGGGRGGEHRMYSGCIQSKKKIV